MMTGLAPPALSMTVSGHSLDIRVQESAVKRTKVIENEVWRTFFPARVEIRTVLGNIFASTSLFVPLLPLTAVS